MNILVIFSQMLVLFAMMFTGYFVYRLGWVTDDMSSRLSKLVVNVFNPALIISSVLGQNTLADKDKISSNLTLVVVYYLILILFSFVIGWVLHPKKELKSIYKLMTIFSNLGFMGIPVVRSIYGNGAVIYVAFYMLGYNLLVYTYGIALTKRSALEKNGGSVQQASSVSWKSTLKKILNPGVIASVIAIIIFMFGIQLPEFVGTYCEYMGNTTIPLSMLLIGVSVAQSNIKAMFDDVRLYMFILLRMVLLPIAVVLLTKQLPIDDVVFGVFVIELAMPVGSIITMMAKENDGDYEYCTKGTVLSTLISIVSIPIVCAFM